MGQGIILMVYVGTLLVHEYAHYFIAKGCGLTLGSTYLTPFGARLVGDMFTLRPVDEIKVALAGPLANLVITTVIVALWWVFPSIYPYTEIIAIANLSTATINLFPCYPLDGGRVLSVALNMKLKRETAERIVSFVGISTSVMLCILFLISIQVQVNTTILVMAVFMFLGSVLDLKKDSLAKRIIATAKNTQSEGGRIVKKVAVPPNTTLFQMAKFLDSAYICEFEIQGLPTGNVSIGEEKLRKLLVSENIYSEIAGIIK